LYPFFDKTFIADSFSCRLGKGTHKAINRFRAFAYEASHNHTRTVWVLKCDIKKFFASIDQLVLLDIISQYITDSNILWLISQIISSFHSTQKGKGLPLGNLTSQLFVNVYMNEVDQFVKHKLKAKYYIRYADDFVFLSYDRAQLENILVEVRNFLWDKLRLQLHSDKISIKTVASGIDFLGWIDFPHHRVLRTKTKRRMMSRIRESPIPETMASYLGLLKHGSTFKLQQELQNSYWFWQNKI
jgi:retron-type reverse transcriptase